MPPINKRMKGNKKAKLIEISPPNALITINHPAVSVFDFTDIAPTIPIIEKNIAAKPSPTTSDAPEAPKAPAKPPMPIANNAPKNPKIPPSKPKTNSIVLDFSLFCSVP